MNNDQPHFMVRRINQRQRNEFLLICPPPCGVEFPSKAKLLDHAKGSHPEIAAHHPDGEAWKSYLEVACSKQRSKGQRGDILAILRVRKQSVVSRPIPEPHKQVNQDSSQESMKLHVGDESQTTVSRPVSAAGNQRHPGHKIPESFKNLSIDQDPAYQHSSPGKGLKRSAAKDAAGDQSKLFGEERLSPRTRKIKTVSGNHLESTEDAARRSRKAGPQLLYNPESHGTNPGGLGKGAIGSSPLFSSQGPQPSAHKDGFSKDQTSPVETSGAMGAGAYPKIEQPDTDADHADQSEATDTSFDADPELLLQPETRPVPYEQLVDEVKGIYGGLVMVEAKCIEVDEKQTQAAQERDAMKHSKLTLEQYSALIALHKTLLNEHHDFFLATQHPSATSALRRLPAKYSIPARMWRHGIHAFLEVLRFRLPDSLDHMLAFIYIAYSMMALLFETVATFQDTWIECLGDLARYRMAIEDDDIRDRETWSGVARSWYRKAVDRNPKTGRLNHHLAILARPYTIQQLSLYARALTCVTPFDSARTSVMTLFNPILEGKDSPHLRPTSAEFIFIKAHGLLFTGKSSRDYKACVDQLVVQGKIDALINTPDLKFREGVGAFIAVSNITALLQYGATHNKSGSKSVLRRAYEAERSRREPPKAKESTSSAKAPKSPASESLSEADVRSSRSSIELAAPLAFGVLRVGLRRHGDPNVFPMLHVYLAFIWSLCETPGTLEHIEPYIPWQEIVEFFNELVPTTKFESSVFSDSFATSEKEKPVRPHSEDYVMQGQIYSLFYYPQTYFTDAKVDQEEKDKEYPSMAETRVLRLCWLAHRLALDGRYIRYDAESKQFTLTPRAKDLRAQNPLPVLKAANVPQVEDVVMSGVGEPEDHSTHIPDSPPRRHSPGLPSNTKPPVKTRHILKREKKDVEMADAGKGKSGAPNLSSKTERYKPEYVQAQKGAEAEGAQDVKVEVVDPDQGGDVVLDIGDPLRSDRLDEA